MYFQKVHFGTFPAFLCAHWKARELVHNVAPKSNNMHNSKFCEMKMYTCTCIYMCFDSLCTLPSWNIHSWNFMLSSFCFCLSLDPSSFCGIVYIILSPLTSVFVTENWELPWDEVNLNSYVHVNCQATFMIYYIIATWLFGWWGHVIG